MRLFCKHDICQDLGWDGHTVVFNGVTCMKCGKHWDHWNSRILSYYKETDVRSKIKRIVEVIKGER